MPKRSPDADTYESDDGFVEDAPKSKKAKIDKGRKVEKKTKASSTNSSAKAKGGNSLWELSNTRRIGISEFKGKTMIDIREYYEKDGEHLPGKKGISLTIEQYNTLLSVLPEVESALVEKGVEVSRPTFDGITPGKAQDQDEDDDDNIGAENSDE